jgi:hypothetical protein
MRAYKSANKSPLIVALSLCILFVGSLVAFAKWSVSGQFGKVVIPLRSGSNVYVIREARGLSSEQLSITSNPDGCIPADPANDFIESNPGKTEVLYSVTAYGLTIYDDAFNHYIKEPTNEWKNIKVILSRSKDPSYDDVHSNPEKYGATLVEIPLNETCWQNFFRRSTILVRLR